MEGYQEGTTLEDVSQEKSPKLRELIPDCETQGGRGEGQLVVAGDYFFSLTS